jgi:anti-sigma regulatory factor (Ser/Thr protein kinase)
MMSGGKTKLTIDARLENLSTINDFIFSAARQLSSKQDILKVQLAVEEACTNIIKHAYSNKGGIITISCEVRENALVVTIRDKARPFDPAAVPPPDLAAGLENRQVGKLGLYLMRNLMDEVSYSYDPEEGNTLIMKKRLGEAKL